MPCRSLWPRHLLNHSHPLQTLVPRLWFQQLQTGLSLLNSEQI